MGIHHLQSLETIECLTPVEKVYCLNMDILERDLYQVALILNRTYAVESGSRDNCPS